MYNTTGLQYRGTSVLFNGKTLSQAKARGMCVSLRQAMSWQDHGAEIMPRFGQSIVVFGLEVLLQVFPADDAVDFLRQRVCPMILWVQDQWPQSCLCFALPQALREDDVHQEILFIKNDQQEIRLSWAMWSAPQEIGRIISPDDNSPVGYYVARI